MGDLFRPKSDRNQENLEKLFASYTCHDPDLGTLPYRSFVAPAAPPERGPLIVFLHGAGGAGRDNKAQLRGGNGLALSALRRGLLENSSPGTILAPQCPAQEAWWSPHSEASRCGNLVGQLLRNWQACDRGRILLMGVSMGAHGVWDLTWRNPGLFAALMPLCGACPPQRAQELQPVPVWGFHGTLDTDVPFEKTREFFSLLVSLGWTARFSELTGVGHRCTQAVLKQFDIAEWLLQQRRTPAY